MDEHTNDKPKSRKAKKTGPMPVKWLEVIDYMVIGGMVFQDAMRSAGYSESYLTSKGHQIKHDVRFCKALELRMAESRTRTEDRRARRMRDLDNIIESSDTLQRDRIAAIQLQGRMNGWLSETIRHETTERQQQLDEAARTEAARMALLALDTRALPDAMFGRKSVVSQIVASGTPNNNTKTELVHVVLRKYSNLFNFNGLCKLPEYRLWINSMKIFGSQQFEIPCQVHLSISKAHLQEQT